MIILLKNHCRLNYSKVLCKAILINLVLLIFFSQLNNYNLKISVIIPTFNREKQIRNSIKSVLNQTYNNLEIIIVDDGSTDNTKEEVKKITDKRVKYIKLKQNKGAAFARNIGIKKSKGNFISFQDSDDYFYPNKLELQLKNLINQNSISLDFCKIRIFFNSTYNYFIPNLETEKKIKTGNYLNELITKGNFISTQAILVKKEILDNFLFDPNFPRLQDFDLILRMIQKIKFSYTQQALVNLYLQNNSLARSKEKLRKAIYMLLSKDYNFNESQKIDFCKYLIKLLNKTY